TFSVSVSVLTLSCIALDRWYAICHPLMLKSMARCARKSIILIWVVSCVIMIPQAIVMECSSLLPELTNKTSLFTLMSTPRCITYVSSLPHTLRRSFLWFWQTSKYAISCGVNRSLGCHLCCRGSEDLFRAPLIHQDLGSQSGSGPAVSAEIKQVLARRKTARMLMGNFEWNSRQHFPVAVLADVTTKQREYGQEQTLTAVNPCPLKSKHGQCLMDI
ncbi:unnamed protein product, partial [Coregonus sp. 'balchen']